ELGEPGNGLNWYMALLYMKPSPGVTTPAEVPRVCVSDTALPAPSRVVTWVVCSGCGAATFGTSTDSPASMRRLSSVAYALDVSRSTGTSTKAGSPRCRVRSANE